LTQIRKRLTYANVMSSIAVFLVLGGSAAYAAMALMAIAGGACGLIAHRLWRQATR